MGKASISIAVTGTYNGAAIERAERSLDRLAVKTAALSSTMGSNLVKSGAKWADVGGGIHNVGAKAEAAGKKMYGVTALLAAGGAAAFKVSGSFESAMARVAGALDDPNAKVDDLRQLALKTGEATIFSASEAGNAMVELAKGGLSAADIQGGALATTMSLAAAGGLDLATSANVVVQSMGAFGLSAKDTGQAANALAGAAAASSADVSDLTQGLSQASAQAHSAGWSIQDTSAVLAGFADAGIKGSDAGTSLKTMLQRLAAPVDKSADVIEELGIKVRDQNGRMKDAAGIAEELRNKLGGLSAAQKDAAIRTIFGSDASRAALVMMNLGREGIQKYTAATNDQEAAQRLANAQMGESEKTLEEMKGAIETAAIGLGTALAPAVKDGANAVADIVRSFSSLDKGTQDFIIKAGVAVAALGPFLSISGKLTKGVGNVITTFGKAKQSIGVYADALRTTDARSLEAYASNKKLSGALARNPVVKAAGGVKQYADAIKKAASTSADLRRAEEMLRTEVMKGAGANKELVTNLRREVDIRRNLAQYAASTKQGYLDCAAAAEKSTGAIKIQATAMKIASTAAATLKGIFATIAPMVVISAIVGVFTSFAEEARKAEEQSRTFKAATQDLIEVTKQGIDTSQKGAGAIEAYGKAAGASKVGVDEAIQAQARLKDTIKDLNTDAGLQITQLQNAYGTIQEYGNRSNLSAEEQARLKAAVKTVNDMCGTQVEVTDAVNGKLRDEKGSIDNVTEALKKNIEQRIEQIKLNVYQQKLTELTKQEVESAKALTDATAAYNQKLQEKNEFFETTRAIWGKYKQFSDEELQAMWDKHVAQSREKENLDRIRESHGFIQQAIEHTTTQYNNATNATLVSKESMEGYINTIPSMMGIMESVGGNIKEFSDGLSTAGISINDFKDLGIAKITELAIKWKENNGDMVKSLIDLQIPVRDEGSRVAIALGDGIASGKIKVEEANNLIKMAAQGDWSSVLQKMKENGIEIPENIANAIKAEGYKPSDAANKVLSAIALTFAKGDTKKAAEMLGRDIDAGLAEAIKKNDADVLRSIGGLSEGIIKKAKEMLESHSPSKVFIRIGSDINAGLQQGMTEGAPKSVGIIQALVEKILGTTKKLPDDMKKLSSDAAKKFLAGIDSGKDPSSRSASKMADAVIRGVKDVPQELKKTASKASKDFATGLADSRRDTEHSARAVAEAAARMRDVGDTYRWGEHISENFARGIRSGVGRVGAAASALVDRAKSFLKFSVPEKGPFSGTERGGQRSGFHLAQNFAEGMLEGEKLIASASQRLTSAAALSITDVASMSKNVNALSKYVPKTSLDVNALAEIMRLNSARFGNRARQSQIAPNQTYNYVVNLNGITINSKEEIKGITRKYLEDLSRLGVM